MSVGVCRRCTAGVCQVGRVSADTFFNNKTVAVRITGADRVVDWEGSEAERVVVDSGRSRGYWSLSVNGSWAVRVWGGEACGLAASAGLCSPLVANLVVCDPGPVASWHPVALRDRGYGLMMVLDEIQHCYRSKNFFLIVDVLD